MIIYNIENSSFKRQKTEPQKSGPHPFGKSEENQKQTPWKQELILETEMILGTGFWLQDATELNLQKELILLNHLGYVCA